jgi:hypothetical protein
MGAGCGQRLIMGLLPFPGTYPWTVMSQVALAACMMLQVSVGRASQQGRKRRMSGGEEPCHLFMDPCQLSQGHLLRQLHTRLCSHAHRLGKTYVSQYCCGIE